MLKYRAADEKLFKNISSQKEPFQLFFLCETPCLSRAIKTTIYIAFLNQRPKTITILACHTTALRLQADRSIDGHTLRVYRTVAIYNWN